MGGKPPLCRCGWGIFKGWGSRNTLPLKRPFAYFSGEGKVGRGTGAEPPKATE